jgi:hypothetical protein
MRNGKGDLSKKTYANELLLQPALTSASASVVVVTLPRSTPSVRPLPRALYVYPYRFLEPRDDCTTLDENIRQHRASTNHNPAYRSLTTRSTSTSTARTSSSRPSSPTTAPSSLPTTGAWSPRSSAVPVPAPVTRSLTVKELLRVIGARKGVFMWLSLGWMLLRSRIQHGAAAGLCGAFLAPRCTAKISASCF